MNLRLWQHGRKTPSVSINQQKKSKKNIKQFRRWWALHLIFHCTASGQKNFKFVAGCGGIQSVPQNGFCWQLVCFSLACVVLVLISLADVMGTFHFHLNLSIELILQQLFWIHSFFRRWGLNWSVELIHITKPELLISSDKIDVLTMRQIQESVCCTWSLFFDSINCDFEFNTFTCKRNGRIG